MNIRIATVQDAPALLEIYKYYVENTAISFEITPPSADEFASRIEKTLKKYPYLVCEDGGNIIGYAYSAVFRDREAYTHCVENTIYLNKDYLRRGYGKALYKALEKALSMQGITNLYACIGYPSEDNEDFINLNSPEFHAHLGYELVGRHNKCGKKFGKFYDIVWMEKIIDAFSEGEIKLFPEIREEFEKEL